MTKGGTNEFHGSGFWFVRNQAVNAANFFAPVVNGEKRQDGLIQLDGLYSPSSDGLPVAQRRKTFTAAWFRHKNRR